MKRIATTLFTAFLLISGLSAQSIADRLARKMEQVAEQKAGEKIGQKLEEKFGKAMEDLYNMGDSSGTTIRVEDDRVIMTDENGDEVELTTEADDTQPSEVIASEFIGSFVMETTEYKGGKVKKDFPMSIHYFIDSYNLAFQVENKEEAAQSIMIFDRRSRKVTTKMIDEDGNKTAMIMPMMRVKAKVKSEDVESSEFSVTATGKTKTIEGFLCKEYQIETEEESATAWVTEEWDFNYAILFDLAQVKNTSTGQMTPWTSTFGSTGAVLEYHSQEKGGDLSRDFYLKNITNGSNTEVFSTAGYQVSDMSAMFGR